MSDSKPAIAVSPAVRASAPDGRRAGAAGALVGLMLILMIWWPLKSGGFFPTVFLPGAILLFGTLIALFAAAPMSLRLAHQHQLALGGLVGLGLWTGLSIIWTPARDLALEDTLRTTVYAGSFFAGLWLTALLGRHAALSLVPWVIGGLVVAAVSCLRIVGADGVELLVNTDGTLEYPFAYRNANALFFILSALTMIGAAARRSSQPPVQAACGGGAVACIALAILCQSRGSVVAAVAGVIALLLLFPFKIRLFAVLAAVTVPVAALIPTLLEPFAAASGQDPVLPPLQRAVELTAIAAFGGALLTLLATSLARHLDAPAVLPRRSAKGGLIAAALAVVALAIGVATVGSPLPGGANSTGTSGARFTYTGDLNRTDFYEVAADQFLSSPVWGEGSGSFRTRYAADRSTDELPRDAHSLEAETLGELGAVGILLVAFAGIGLAGGAWRARRLGKEPATLSAIALAVGVAWLTQASIDWFTSFPALTAPVTFVLGAAAGPATVSRGSPVPTRWRLLGAAAAATIALVAVPVFFAERDTLRAAREWRADPALAFERLDRAAELNPLADTPLQVKAQIARELEQPDRALTAIRKAIERQPTEWRSYVIEASLLAEQNPAEALTRLERARELNPLSPEVEALEQQIESSDGARGKQPKR